MDETEGLPTLFTAWNTPVKAKPGIAVNVVGLWAGLSWLAGRRHPELGGPARLLVGALSALAALSADVGHAMAHTVSARYAGAPTDEILLSEGMPRTLYRDNDVAPRVHILRSVGGPIFSVAGLLASLLFRALTPRESVAHFVADWSCIGHGFILGGSLSPLPIVDGGVILKWTLVERGRAPEQADATVRQVDLALGMAATTAGVAFAATRRWLPGLALVAGGAVALAAALDKLH